MATTTTTTFMLMVLPIPQEEVGPLWAQELIAALTAQLDPHDHSEGKGTFVTPAGLNLNQDLDFADRDTGASNNARNVRAVTFESLSQALAEVTDYNSFFVVGPDVYFLDGNGNAVQITLNGSVIVAAGNISGMVNGAAVSYSDLAKVFTFEQSPGINAGLDVGSVRVREEVGGGKGVSLQAPVGLAGDYNLIFPAGLPGGGETRLVTLDAAGNLGDADDPTITSRPTFEGINPGTTADTTLGNIRYNAGDEEAYVGGAWVSLTGDPSTARAGQMVGYGRTNNAAVATGNTLIPLDNTIPQAAEGNNYFTLIYTPKKIGNALIVRLRMNLSTSNAGAATGLIAAIVKNAGNAVAANVEISGGAGLPTMVDVEFAETVVSLAAVTWGAKAGGSVAGTLTVNGSIAARLFGGVWSSSLEIMEYAQ